MEARGISLEVEVKILNLTVVEGSTMSSSCKGYKRRLIQVYMVG